MSNSSSSTPVGTQKERDIDSRLNNAILDSSLLINEAMKQLAKPCVAPTDETTADEDYVPPTPLDIAITKSNRLLEEAQLQLGSPTSAPLSHTEEELAEKKAADAWSHTYHQIDMTNEVRSGASQSFLESILKDIEVVDDESGKLPKTSRSAPPKRINDASAASAEAAREQRRAQRASRVCNGPMVAAVVAKIEELDDAATLAEPQKHVRSTDVRSFGK